MRKFLLLGLALSIFSTATIFAGAPNVTNFPYQKDVVIPQLSWKKMVAISLDNTIMGRVSERFSNIDLYNGDNQEVPFEVYYNEFARFHGAEVVKTSSLKDGKVADLIDGDIFTTFVFDEKIDRTDASWAIIDLGSPQRIVRAKVFVPEGRVRSMEIKGGMTQDDMRTLVSKRPHAWQTDFHSPLIRYIKVSLWGVGVKVDDIKLYNGASASIYFEGNPREKYRLLYGGATDLIRYKERHGEAQKFIVEGKLTKEIINAAFPEDFDGDGLNNRLDNCPFVSNASQSDSDSDRVGNKCDNASRVKNSNQYDTDFDGVGDIIDNCMLIPNKDQKDRDNDGYGNACDNAHAKDVDSETKNYTTTIMAFVIGFILAAGVVIGWKKKEWVIATTNTVLKKFKK
jgi:hypothetical protein